jgi:hypothetical protein
VKRRIDGSREQWRRIINGTEMLGGGSLTILLRYPFPDIVLPFPSPSYLAAVYIH